MAIEVPFGELSPRTCAVLGGRGFLGRSLVYRLLQLGHWIVRVADSAHSLHLDDTDPADSLLRHALSSSRASYHRLDVRDVSLISKAIEGSSVVFYMDATDLEIQDFYLCYMVIVQGAKNVISACRGCKVRQLIYNSSADIIFDGSHDICNRDESLPCNWRFEDTLSDLKAQAEALILFANNIDGLLTCALRPSNVFGPGDTQLIPFLVDLAKSGWAKFIIGSGENVSDFTYAENVIHAHICAAGALDLQTVSVAGKVFFITNLEPIKFWDFVSLILEGLGYQRPLVKLPPRILQHVLLAVRWMHEKLDSRKYNHFLLSHFFHLASHTRTFNCTAAQKHIGYSPVVSLEDGIALTIKSFSHLAKDSSLERYIDCKEQSKAEKLLGSGKVADILLWREEKETFVYFLVLYFLFYWFLISGRTFTTSAASLLLSAIAILYGYGILPSNISHFTIQRIPLSSFEISEMFVKDLVTSTASLWNRWFNSIKILVKGEDWNHFFKVASSLYFFKSFVLQSLTVAIGAALVFAFTAFFIYEQYESEIDGLVVILFNNTKGFLMRYLPASIASLLERNRILHEGDGTVADSKK